MIPKKPAPGSACRHPGGYPQFPPQPCPGLDPGVRTGFPPARSPRTVRHLAWCFGGRRQVGIDHAPNSKGPELFTADGVVAPPHFTIAFGVTPWQPEKKETRTRRA